MPCDMNVHQTVFKSRKENSSKCLFSLKPLKPLVYHCLNCNTNRMLPFLFRLLPRFKSLIFRSLSNSTTVLHLVVSLFILTKFNCKVRVADWRDETGCLYLYTICLTFTGVVIEWWFLEPLFVLVNIYTCSF